MGMRIKRVLCTLSFIFLLYSCEEVSPLFQADQTYQVSAMRDNVSLDEYALIKKNEEIQPVFARAVRGDPDLQGLQVYLRASDRMQTEEIVLYTIEKDKKNENETDEKSETDEKEGEDDQNVEENKKIILVNRMDEALPSFSLPQNLESGVYTIVF
jgi:hypothetical protein